MAYIYKITNDINGKIYVGKTEFSIEKRFREHCEESTKRTEEHRPLYAAMRKYGVENFHVELLEETDNPEEREIYWIENLGSFKWGYNATKGGDGRRYLDYNLIIKTYQQTLSASKVAKILDCDCGHVRNILKEKNFDLVANSHTSTSKAVAKCEKTSLEILKVFQSLEEAGRSIGKPARHIAECAKGKRKSAYGFAWKFI